MYGKDDIVVTYCYIRSIHVGIWEIKGIQLKIKKKIHI